MRLYEATTEEKLRTSGHWQGPRQELVSLPHQCKVLLVAAHGCERQHTTYFYTAADVHKPWAATKRALYQSGGDTSPCQGPYSTVVCPELHIGCGIGRELYDIIVKPSTTKLHVPPTPSILRLEYHKFQFSVQKSAEVTKYQVKWPSCNLPKKLLQEVRIKSHYSL